MVGRESPGPTGGIWSVRVGFLRPLDGMKQCLGHAVYVVLYYTVKGCQGPGSACGRSVTNLSDIISDELFFSRKMKKAVHACLPPSPS